MRFRSGGLKLRPICKIFHSANRYALGLIARREVCSVESVGRQQPGLRDKCELHNLPSRWEPLKRFSLHCNTTRSKVYPSFGISSLMLSKIAFLNRLSCSIPKSLPRAKHFQRLLHADITKDQGRCHPNIPNLACRGCYSICRRQLWSSTRVGAL